MGAHQMKILNSTVARVKSPVTKFDSKATIRLHAHSFGLGVSPVDYDQLAEEIADMNAICEGLVYSRDDLDAAPIEVEPIAAPDVIVTDGDSEKTGRFNTLIHDWSMAQWVLDDDAASGKPSRSPATLRRPASSFGSGPSPPPRSARPSPSRSLGPARSPGRRLPPSRSATE
jgi:hypothetical protein